MVTMEIGEPNPIGNHHRSFQWCQRWPPIRPPLPKIGSQIHPQRCRTKLL